MGGKADEGYGVGMFKPSAAVVAALRGFLVDGDGDAAAMLETELGTRRPDLTGVLLHSAHLAQAEGKDLGRTLTAAVCRAGAARLAELHPGASIEIRVPPFTAVQVGFGTGSRHTRGTPPNVVEMTPTTFIGLATGNLTWGEADVRASGSHAHEAAAAFPLH